MQPFKVRLVYERDTLAQLLNNLENFLETEEFLGLVTEDQALLIQQKHAMINYLSVLNKRITRYNTDLKYSVLSKEDLKSTLDDLNASFKTLSSHIARIVI